MTFETLASEAPKKGIHLIGTGDCLHPTWLKELKGLEKVDEGTFELNNTRFIPTVEVQAEKRVHHLIMFPSLSSVEEFRAGIKHKSKNISTDGRPMVSMTGAEIAELALDVDALFGPCHAFTPWTGLYGHFDSLQACYGEHFQDVSFLELGLSADSNYADRLKELRELTFLTNSDAHSPYPLRLAREFNQLKVKDITFNEIKKALLRLGGRKCTLNVGLPPEEGKYNQSACSRCFKRYTLIETKAAGGKCTCGGAIKKGVLDRINELATNPKPQPPKHRPKYLRLIPLVEIISKALNYSSSNSVGVTKVWKTLISEFGNEVEILLYADIKKIKQITSAKVGNAINCFRENKIIIHPGGGGKYGQIELPNLS